MDLLSDKPELNLYDTSWKIYSENSTQPPQYLGDNSQVVNSLVNEGCIVNGRVENSVLFPGVYIGNNSQINDCLIMPNARIEDNVVLERAIVGEGSKISAGVSLSGDHDFRWQCGCTLSDSGIVVIDENTVI